MLKTYGWNDDFQRQFDSLKEAEGLEPGRIIEQQRGLYRVVTAGGRGGEEQNQQTSRAHVSSGVKAQAQCTPVDLSRPDRRSARRQPSC